MVAWALVLALGGCRDATFECSGDVACVDEGVQGVCEADGFCSFPDPGCDSGRRYGQHSDNAYAGQCVPPSGAVGTQGSSSSASGTTQDLTATVTSGLDSSSSGLVGTDSTGSDSSGGPPLEHNIAFVTSETFTPGALGALAAADVLCNTAAGAEGLDGEYIAWLSTDSIDAIDRLGSARGWVRVDGRPLADRQIDLAQGLLWHPINVDETNTALRELRVATGTNGDGTASGLGNCTGWTDTAVGAVYRAGLSGNTAPGWTDRLTAPCDEPAHLYCFGTSNTAALTVEPASGRLAFLTQTRFTGDQTLAAFDAQCAADAMNAGLGGSFLAFVAAGGASALARFSTAGDTWVNTRGIPIVDAATDLTLSPDLVAPVRFLANGDLAVGGFFWSGATSPVAVPGSACADWSELTGTGIRADLAGTDDWMDFGGGGCGEQNRVVCFEE